MSKDKKTVFISGNFNILHPGHLRLFRFAKECGKRLVVAVFSDQIAGKEAHVPEMLRLEGVKSNSWVDEAFIVNEAITDVIRRLQPDIVVKGKEHEFGFNSEIIELEKYGGSLLFSSGEMVFSSLDLLRKEFIEADFHSISLPLDYMRRHNIETSRLRELLQRFASLKVCIVGDLIIDEYITCQPLGMSQEDPTIAVTPIDTTRFVGGAGVVAAHASGMGAQVHFVSVTGVSGSGKSTLINDILLKSLENHFSKTHIRSGDHKEISGLDNVDKVIAIDQSPIGRTPRSNPATYIGAFTPIRELYSNTALSKERGYKPGQFSFNVADGRCFACEGDGVKKIEMQFLSDVYVKCDECKGKRYNSETLSVLYKGKNVSDVLQMTVYEALTFFENVPSIQRKLQTVNDVGLGYIKLGQSSTTLSGGEAQRVKLASELSKRGTGKTLYILDEPTTGLHFADVQKLLDVLNRLVNLGNTVVVIEHNMDIIKNSDWLIDLGPEGGDEGGSIVTIGTPSDVSKSPGSYTGKYLKKLLKNDV